MYLLMTIFSSHSSLLGFYGRIKHTQYWKCALILSLETTLLALISRTAGLHAGLFPGVLHNSPASQTSQPSFFLPLSLLSPFFLLLPLSFLSLFHFLLPIPLSSVPLSFLLFLPLSPFFLLVFETGSHHVSQTGLEPALHTQPPACWDRRSVLLLLLSFTFYRGHQNAERLRTRHSPYRYMLRSIVRVGSQIWFHVFKMSCLLALSPLGSE